MAGPWSSMTIRVAYSGTPFMKAFVPSIGSTTHRRPVLPSTSSSSSPMIPSPGCVASPRTRFGGEVGGGRRRPSPLCSTASVALEPRERAGAGVLGEFDREQDRPDRRRGCSWLGFSGAVVRSEREVDPVVHLDQLDQPGVDLIVVGRDGRSDGGLRGPRWVACR